MKAVPPQIPTLAPLRRQRVGRGRRRHAGVERRVEAGHGGRPGQGRARPLERARGTSAGGGERGRSRPRVAPSTRSSMTTGPVNCAPPWTIRCPTASIGPMAASAPSQAADVGRRRVAVAGRRSPPPASSSSRTTQLEAAGAGVDDQDAHASQVRARPSRGSPVRLRRARRVYARHVIRWSTMSLADVPGRARQPGDPVDHVHDEVEPVEVVEHDHVERGGRRALLLVAAHVEVVVVRGAGR